MNDNPYSTQSHLSYEPQYFASSDVESLMSIAKTVFIAWEKLRLVYIAVLASTTFLLVGFSGIANVSLMISIAVGAFFANAFYFAGPTVDTYIRWLGYRRAWPRWVLFVGGTMLSIVLTIAWLASYLLPSQP